MRPLAAPPHLQEVEDRSQIGEVRRAAVTLAGQIGLAPDLRARAAIVATEMATNIFMHARKGTILLRRLDGGLEILALDRGPGMADVGRCLEDGYSTAGTSGTGLGAVRRLSSRFDIHSLPGVGTAVLAVFLATAAPPGRLDLGAVCLPRQGEDRSGDAWGAVSENGRTTLLVADGLGHGGGAADAAEAAVACLDGKAGAEPAEILEAAHQRLRSSRGAAAAVVRIAPGEGRLSAAGVGNIAGTLLKEGRTHGLAFSHGILGQPPFRSRPFDIPWSLGATLVLHSDGLTSHWDLARYPGLLGRSASIVAGVLWRDHTRGRDDVTVVVVKETAA